MSKHYFATAAALSLLTAATVSAGAFPAHQTLQAKDPLRYLPKAGNTFSPKAVDKDGKMTADNEHTGKYYQASVTVGSLVSPEGADWTYTLELDGDIITQNEYYTEIDFRTFLIKVFDENQELVGQAKGTMERPEGANKCQSITAGVQLTRSFFNTNSSDIEIMMIGNYNPGAPYYGAKQITQAYTLTDEIPADGSTMLFKAPGIYTSAINCGSGSIENFVMGFFNNSTWDNEDPDKATYTVYKKAGYGTPASEVTKFDVDLRLTDSDGQNEALPFVMTAKGNDVYVATALYEKSFLADTSDPDNPTMREQNNYVITLYKSSYSGYEKVATTKIPCENAEGDFTYRSYALGNFSGAGDITFEFGDGNSPCYIITVVDSNQQDDTSAYYAIYDLEGNLVKRFGNASDGYSLLTDVEGQPAQYGFQMTSKDGEYGLVLIDWPSLEEVGFVPSLFENDGEVWLCTTVPDRVKTDKGIFYVAQVQAQSAPSEGISAFVGWFTQQGQLDHIDELALGERVAKVIPDLSGRDINPYLFNTNKQIEYLAWVYRYIPNSSGTTLELVVCDADSKILASRLMSEKSQSPQAYVANPRTAPCIVLSYHGIVDGEHVWKNEFINLPLNKFEGEGTVESPYIVRTYGDLDQIRNNLTSHFRLANSIDCANQIFRPIDGVFTGSIDGNGFEIKNLTINGEKSGSAFFRKFGVADDFSDEDNSSERVIAALKNITFSNPQIQLGGSAYGVQKYALIAAEANNALISNVNVVDFNLTDETSMIKFGVFACEANNLTVEGCGAKNITVDTAKGNFIGGIAAELRGSKVTACSFEGTLKGSATVGGIAANTMVAPSVITDCHVDAAISGGNNVGGILGYSNRSVITRCLVEGSIDAYDNAGGIAGTVESPDVESADAIIIENCVLAIDEFKVSDEAVAAHRIAGYTSIDDGPTSTWVPTDPNDPEAGGQYVQSPAAADAKIGTNYVISAIAEIETPADGKQLATEGTTKTDAADTEWFKSIGYAFGNSVGSPWAVSDATPVLFFEDTIGTGMIFADDVIYGTEGESAEAVLVLSNILPADVTCESSDSEVAKLTAVEAGENDNEAIVRIELLKAGEATFTASAGDFKAVLYVTVKKYSGVNNVEAAVALMYVDGTIVADGCTIEIFDLQGRLAAAGRDILSTGNLNAGLYIVRAISADGNASILKVRVK